MDFGRRSMWAAYAAAGRPAPDPILPAVTQAAAAAVQRFWQLLIQFADGSTLPPDSNWAGLGTAHPFIATRPTHGEPAEDFCPLVVRLPHALLPAL